MDGELIGNHYHAWELMMANGIVLAPEPYSDRFRELDGIPQTDALNGIGVTVCLTYVTTRAKHVAMAELLKTRAEGIVFKLHTAPYRAGRNGQHKKFKFIKTATCKVVRVGDKGHDSATLALYDKAIKSWVEVGRASMIGKDKRIGVGSLVEVLFLYATKCRRLYQPRIKCLRNDVDESACTVSQLAHAFKEGVAA